MSKSAVARKLGALLGVVFAVALLPACSESPEPAVENVAQAAPDSRPEPAATVTESTVPTEAVSDSSPESAEAVAENSPKVELGHSESPETVAKNFMDELLNNASERVIPKYYAMEPIAKEITGDRTRTEVAQSFMQCMLRRCDKGEVEILLNMADVPEEVWLKVEGNWEKYRQWISGMVKNSDSLKSKIRGTVGYAGAKRVNLVSATLVQQTEDVARVKLEMVREGGETIPSEQINLVKESGEWKVKM